MGRLFYPVARGNLKVEISYRTGFKEFEVAQIDGIKTYRVARLIEQKLAALEAKLADVTARKDAMENELAVSASNGDAKQLKRLNQSYAKLQSEWEEVNSTLEILIASL